MHSCPALPTQSGQAGAAQCGVVPGGQGGGGRSTPAADQSMRAPSPPRRAVSRGRWYTEGAKPGHGAGANALTYRCSGGGKGDLPLLQRQRVDSKCGEALSIGVAVRQRGAQRHRGLREGERRSRRQEGGGPAAHGQQAGARAGRWASRRTPGTVNDVAACRPAGRLTCCASTHSRPPTATHSVGVGLPAVQCAQ